jgi:AcrR family transcriptional regulator
MDKHIAPEPARPSARERLLAAADELFYEHGIHTVGIDRVIERAGVAKASLYGVFGSKDELIRAYLQARHDARKARITARIAGHDTPRERLLSVFDAMRDFMADPKFRGCAFNRAAAEARPGEGIQAVCDDARGWVRDLFTGLARDAGAADPQALARQLVLLYDGATVAAQMEGGTASALAARAAAALMLDAATGAGKASPRALKTSARSPAARRRA